MIATGIENSKRSYCVRLLALYDRFALRFSSLVVSGVILPSRAVGRELCIDSGVRCFNPLLCEC
ncbi:hypothetical protein F511_28306 [Dorcoceras hygrometricum]|uniref:Uncharacterized protein n=1 Tax=Dorcoceras hygrometricum TaxID=472368 RepID=A0A2Z7AKD1_9LAMI|nr:hypothetical protein F511_28306 [Dorcoceras hygrometricum]